MSLNLHIHRREMLNSRSSAEVFNYNSFGAYNGKSRMLVKTTNVMHLITDHVSLSITTYVTFVITTNVTHLITDHVSLSITTYVTLAIKLM